MVKFLELFNYILAIIGMGLAFVHFFIDGIKVPLFIILFVPLLMFSLMGIEQFKIKRFKSGYFYIVAAVIISIAFINDLFTYLY